MKIERELLIYKKLYHNCKKKRTTGKVLKNDIKEKNKFYDWKKNKISDITAENSQIHEVICEEKPIKIKRNLLLKTNLSKSYENFVKIEKKQPNYGKNRVKSDKFRKILCWKILQKLMNFLNFGKKLRIYIKNRTKEGKCLKKY